MCLHGQYFQVGLHTGCYLWSTMYLGKCGHAKFLEHFHHMLRWYRLVFCFYQVLGKSISV